MRVLRDGPNDLSMTLSCITIPTGYVRWPIGLWDPLVCIYIEHLCPSVIHQSHHLTGSVVPRVFFIWSILCLLLFSIWFDPNLNWVIRITWLSVFSVATIFESGFYSVLLYYYLAYLFKNSVCPKRFLLWPLVGTESLSFVIISFFSFIDSYLILMIW
jgi:hypothetical protein